MSAVIAGAAARAFMLLRVGGCFATINPLPVNADLDTVGVDNATLSVPAGARGSSIPQGGGTASCKVVGVAAEAVCAHDRGGVVGRARKGARRVGVGMATMTTRRRILGRRSGRGSGGRGAATL